MWHHRVDSTPESLALTFRQDGAWTSLSWRGAHERVRRIANGLLAFGLSPEERACIIADTSAAWILADLAILCAGGATSTLYPSYKPEECLYILRDCEARVVFCGTDALARKILAVRDQLPALGRIIVFDPASALTDDPHVATLSQLEEEGARFAEDNPDAYAAAHQGIEPDRLATLMYTSGTTGRPKGVMLTHDAWVYEAEALDALGILSPADKQLLFLPLSHVFAKVMQVSFIRLGIPTVVEGDPDRLMPTMIATAPTWMGAVPRVFEKAYNRIVTEANQAGGMRLKLFKWALRVGEQVSTLRQRGKQPTGLLAAQFRVADRLVFSEVKASFGGRVRFLISGGAPLSKEIAAFFHACDILVLEGYGLTESAAASCVNRLDAYKFGTVGQPLPGCQVKLGEDGEVMIKSRGVMRGYHNDPEETARVLSPDGWLYTGDIGLILDSGHLQITGRKKELIVTASGKNIAPTHVENLLKTRSPYVSQVVLHGDNRPFCTALVALSQPAVTEWARQTGLAFVGFEDLTQRPEVHALIAAAIDALNQELPSFEAIRRFAVLSEDITIDNGLLTPSLKVRRDAVEARYQHLLDAFYAGTVSKLA